MSPIAPTTEELARSGVPDAARVAAALAPVGDWMAPPVRDQVLAGLRRAADPAQAAFGLAELLGLAPLASDSLDLEALLVVLGGSVALRATLLGEGPAWLALVREMASVPARTIAEHGTRLAALLDTTPAERPDVQRVLRQYVRREEVRIGGRDLAGMATVDETVREISALAEAAVGAALGATRRRLAAEWGATAGLPFVIFGMGKLGGRELNYSSDVDLVYVYEDDATLSDGRTRRECFSRVAEELTRTLSEVTDDGFCHRVDLRLRPGGNEGPIAIALPALLSYYESWGQTWERAVWLKARPVAGDLALGERVLGEMEPFVYRRYLDFGTLEALQAMKQRVDASLRDRSHRRRNVKLGRGGIREVEFLVQAQQLVHGGKDARLRLRGTLETLERLAAAGYVPGETRDALADAYRFLRDVEHKLQIVHRRQTQTIPAAEDEVRLLARRLGYVEADGLERFWEDHGKYTGDVRAAFEDLFRADREATGGDADVSPAIVSLLDPLATDPRIEATLAELEFDEPAQARRDLALLVGGPPRAPASDRRRGAMERIGPALLGEIVASADRDRALGHLATFLANVGARTSYLHLLAEKPAVRGLLVRLFASSEFLSRYFVQNPELLEALVRVDLVRVAPALAEQDAELADRLGAAGDLEAELDVIRRFRREEFLRIGIHDLEGNLSGVEVEAQLTDLATVCLTAAVGLARRDVCRRTGVADSPATDGLAVIGMGKLGGRELAYGSDLDLVFVWAAPEGSWPGPLDPLEFYTRVVQRTISSLQTQTNEGYAYKIDTRLRPSGNQGTLVTSVDGFEDYHRRGAAVWERQALVKARVVHGPPSLGLRIGAAIEAFVYGRSLTDDECAEIRRVRRRMELERGSEQSIKTGQGGVVDVEFAVQVLQLRHGHADGGLRTPSTREALAALGRSAHVSAAVVEALAGGYAFLRRLEHRLRIERDQPGDAVPEDARARLRLARGLGYDGAPPEPVEGLIGDLARHRNAIRGAYATVVGEEPATS